MDRIKLVRKATKAIETLTAQRAIMVAKLFNALPFRLSSLQARHQ